MRAEVERVLTIELQVKVNERRMSDSRMREAYDRGVQAAAAAVAQVLLEGSIAGVRSSMTYDYRHAENWEEEFRPLEEAQELVA